MVLGRVALGVIVGAALPVLWADPALASITGDCTGQAVLRGDDGSIVNIDADVQDEVTIPRAADVEYEGSIAVEGEDMPYSGHIELKVDGVPGGPVVERWRWPGEDDPDGETDANATNGTESYDLDLPADLLGGVKGEVTGTHTQAGKTCTGRLDVKIAGSVVNPGSIGSAVLTGVAAAGLAFAARGKR